jgi:hypothetical protein
MRKYFISSFSFTLSNLNIKVRNNFSLKDCVMISNNSKSKAHMAYHELCPVRALVLGSLGFLKFVHHPLGLPLFSHSLEFGKKFLT